MNKKKLNIRSWLRKLGPGLVTGAGDDDPSGIATYSQAGAKFGYVDRGPGDAGDGSRGLRHVRDVKNRAEKLGPVRSCCAVPDLARREIKGRDQIGVST